MDNANERLDERHDEVGLVDILSVLIAKRKLWIAITLAGMALGLAVSIPGLFRSGPLRSSTIYSSTTRAYIPDSKTGDSAAALASCGAAADLVAKGLGSEVRDEYLKNVSATYDAKTRILSLSVKADTDEKARAMSLAGINAMSILINGQGQGYNQFIAETLETQRRQLENEAVGAMGIGVSDELRLAAISRVARMEAEAYRDSMQLDPNDVAFLALDSFVKNRAATERLAVDTYAKAMGGSIQLSTAARSALAREAAALLVERVSLYRALIPAGNKPIFTVDISSAPVVIPGFVFPTKKFILIIFASLFIGILAAFCVNA